jgi:hypothetical protein
MGERTMWQGTASGLWLLGVALSDSHQGNENLSPTAPRN